MMRRSPSPTRSAIVVAGIALLAAGCSSSGSPSASGGPSRPPAGATSSAPASSGSSSSAAPAVNPLTGLAPSKNPVVIVKIDDTAWGRPQLGVDKADIVYIKQVEGGLTRLVAVFDSTLPVVEPVRSTRADDPELVQEYGPVDYVFSGGDHAELAPLRHTHLRKDSNDRGGPGFSRDPNRTAPYNVRAVLTAVAKALKGPRAHNIGLTWSQHLTGPSAAGTRVRTTVGRTPVGFDWDRKRHEYVRIIDGRRQHTATGALIATPNVIVQFCRSTVYHKDVDSAGNPAEWTHTIGSGKVVVFRDGRRVEGTWHRPNVHAGTQLLDGHGKSIALTPGGAWFVQVATGTPLNH